MKIPVEWLKKYINTNVSAKKIAEKLTLSGIEIEGLSHSDFDRVIIGEIISIKKHPSADKLQIVEVNAGSKLLKIVCGANNIEIGQKVPIAIPGAFLGEKEIQKTRIRGIESEGMLCSEAELSISDDRSGIMILDPRSKIGANLVSALDIGGIVLDAEINPNRGDLLSILGIAREVSAILNKKINEPKINFKEISENISANLNVRVNNFDYCTRYIARLVEFPEINESPKWLQDRISSCGIRPINTVVDITNYVMLEYGQPLHAFDFDKIKNKKIIVRRAKEGEKIKTLDNVERKLNKDNLIIADYDKPIAIAGVMGSTNSEVDLSTKKIVLESAVFNKTSIRRTGNSLALRTEAVTRFEKGIPFDLPEIAVKRACHLFEKICKAKIYKGQIDVCKTKPKNKKVDIDINQVEKLLGLSIAKSKILKILNSLGFKKIKINKNYIFSVPWWRMDISIPEDLIEEIARIYGYDKIPTRLPSGRLPNFSENYEIKWINVLQNTLVGLGFFEVYTYSFIGKSLLEKACLNTKELIKIENPLTYDQEYMRSSLIPSLLDIASKNIKNFDDFKIFEIANIYSPRKNHFSESKRITGLTVDRDKNSFYNIKNVVEVLLKSLGIFYNNINIELIAVQKNLISKKNIFRVDRLLELKINNEFVGLVGEVDSKILNNFNIKEKVNIFTFSLEKLFKFATNARKFKPISKFPQTRFDLAILVDKDIAEIDVRKTIIEGTGNLSYRVELFDIYTGKQLDLNKKSLAYHIILQSSDHTLAEEEVKEIRKKIIDNLKNKLKADIRDKQNS